MQQCEHLRVWCEHECHCDTIAAVGEQIATNIEACAGPNPSGDYPQGLRDAARIARGNA
jgi:hypothetical protein